METNTNTEPTGVANQEANQPTNNIPGAAPGETKAETMQRLFKVTINGQEQEVDEKELLRGYTHSKAAEQKMQEAAMTRKQAQEVMQIMKENPLLAFQKLGIDPRKFASYVTDLDLKESMMTPDQKKMRDMHNQLQYYQQQEKAAQQRYQQEQAEIQNQQMTAQIQTDIISTLESNSVPKTPFTVGRIAYYMEAAMNAGYEDVKPQDVIQYVREDYAHDFKQYIGGLSDDTLSEFLGKDILLKAAKKTVSAGMNNGVVNKKVNEHISRTKEKKILSPREYFKR